MNDREAFEEILQIARRTSKQIKKYTKDHGSFQKPVDIDTVKTLKAMFYEEVVEILKKRKDD